MSASEVYKQCYVKLVMALPMNDSLFLAQLFSCGLFHGDLKNQIKVEKTSADKATCFLDHVIGPSISVGNSTNFHKLLNIMEESENDRLQVLAEEIKTTLKEEQINTTGYCNVATYFASVG